MKIYIYSCQYFAWYLCDRASPV